MLNVYLSNNNCTKLSSGEVVSNLSFFESINVLTNNKKKSAEYPDSSDLNMYYLLVEEDDFGKSSNPGRFYLEKVIEELVGEDELYYLFNSISWFLDTLSENQMRSFYKLGVLKKLLKIEYLWKHAVDNEESIKSEFIFNTSLPVYESIFNANFGYPNYSRHFGFIISRENIENFETYLELKYLKREFNEFIRITNIVFEYVIDECGLRFLSTELCKDKFIDMLQVVGKKFSIDIEFDYQFS